MDHEGRHPAKRLVPLAADALGPETSVALIEKLTGSKPQSAKVAGSYSEAWDKRMLAKGRADMSGFSSKFSLANEAAGGHFALWLTDHRLDFVFSRSLRSHRQLIDIMLSPAVMAVLVAVSVLLFLLFRCVLPAGDRARSLLHLIAIWLEQPFVEWRGAVALALLTGAASRGFSICFHARLKSRMVFRDSLPFQDIFELAHLIETRQLTWVTCVPDQSMFRKLRHPQTPEGVS